MAKSTVNSAAGSGKSLVIVESPAKAKTINKYLGANFVVKASMGHVRDLPQKGMGVDIEHHFEPTYEILESREKLISELRKAAKGSDEVFLATDLDREGEAIAWHLAAALNLDGKTTKRVVFNEITKTAIQNAFKNPRHIDESKVNAQQARRVLDRLVGYKISPLLWKKVARGLSAGRVQSVATKLVVDREREIMAFMPEEYWRLVGVFTTDILRASELVAQWESFLTGNAEEEAVDDGTDSALAAGGPTNAQKQEWMQGNKAFKAELIEVNAQKFKVTAAEDAQDIAMKLGMVELQIDTKDNDGTNGPRGIPAKGPAEHISKIFGRVTTGGDAPTFVVRELINKQSTNRAPGPFSTSTLQQAASNSIGFGAQRTMRTAQSLYEGVDLGGTVGLVGLITYMRTDSQNISADAITMVRGFINEKFGPKYLPESPNFYTSKAGAQEAHEAIRPTDVSLTPQQIKGALSDEQFKLYELIWKRFVACQMTPAQWLVTDAIIDAKQGSRTIATFKATGRTLQFDGFTRVAGVFSRGDDQILPKLDQGQKVAPLDLTPTQHFTSPPPRYSEASLVKALESEGIGRPSTYASIINTIQDPRRPYVESKGRTLYATDLGMKVTDKLIEGFPDIMDTGFTRRVEAELDQVEESHRNWVDVVQSFYEPLERDLATAEERMTHARAEAEPSDYKCPTCQAPMVYRLSKRGKRFLSCSRYPECTGAMNVDREGKPMTVELTEFKCPVCGKFMQKRMGRFGPFLGCSGYPECKTILNLDRKTGQPLPPKPPAEDTGIPCPKCGKKHLLVRTGKRGKFISCGGYPRCRMTLPFERLEEIKTAQEQGKWPDDILAKIGGKAAEVNIADPNEKKPAKKRATKKKVAATPPAETPTE